MEGVSQKKKMKKKKTPVPNRFVACSYTGDPLYLPENNPFPVSSRRAQWKGEIDMQVGGPDVAERNCVCFLLAVPPPARDSELPHAGIT